MFSLYSFNILTACIFYIKFLFFRILLGNNAVDITFFCIKLISVLTVPVKRDIPHNMETSACSQKKKKEKRKKKRKKVMCGSGRWEWLKEMWWLKYMIMAQRDVLAQWDNDGSKEMWWLKYMIMAQSDMVAQENLVAQEKECGGSSIWWWLKEMWWLNDMMVAQKRCGGSRIFSWLNEIWWFNNMIMAQRNVMAQV